MSDESPSNSETDENPGNVENRRESLEEVTNEYEKQRVLRIRENRAKFEAMGLPNLISSTLASLGNGRKGTGQAKKKGGAKNRDQDDEYQPPDDEDGESSSSEEEEDDEDRTFRSGGSSRRASVGKGKKRSPLKTEKSKKCLPVQRHMKEMDTFDDDNDALQQAIALSLGGLPENSGANENNVHLIGRNKDANIPEATRTKKRRKSNIKRVQMSEDEVIVYFFSIDEAGKGKITLPDLRRVANAHDFDWTDKEMADMIECFDSNRDGKLILNDFQKIVARCNMIRGSENA